MSTVTDGGSSFRPSIRAARGSVVVASAPSRAHAAVRLALDPVVNRRGAIDGGWWPASRNVNDEIPVLVTEVDRLLHTAVLRVGLHPDTWTHIPHRMHVNGHTVRVGWFASIDKQLVSLHTARAEYDLELMVIPPDTPADEAAAALALAVRGFAGANDLPTSSWRVRSRSRPRWPSESGKTTADDPSRSGPRSRVAGGGHRGSEQPQRSQGSPPWSPLPIARDDDRQPSTQPSTYCTRSA